MVLRATILGAAAIAFAACGGDPPSFITPVASTDELYSGYEPVYTESVQRVIRTPAELAQLWDRIRDRVSAPSAQPTVAFNREMVVVIGAGQRRSGDRLRTDSVGVRNGQFQVYFTVEKDCVEGAPTIYPLQIVKTVRSEYLPARFTESIEDRPGCR